MCVMIRIFGGNTRNFYILDIIYDSFVFYIKGYFLVEEWFLELKGFRL